MYININYIGSSNPIGENFPLKKSDARFIGVQHNSKVVAPLSGTHFWNSPIEYGDVPVHKEVSR